MQRETTFRPAGQRMRRWWDDAAGFVEAHGSLLGVLLLGVYFVIALGDASTKPLWYDELITVHVASFPRVGAILSFFNDGKDTTSATCALIVHYALKLPISPELSARLPFLLAFLSMLVFVYLFMRRRYPVASALSAGIALIAPAPLRNLGVEARGYALLLAGTALAMFCWQTAVNRTTRRLPSLLGLWFGLAFAINAHSFGIFLLIPFAAAQAVQDYRRRGFNFAAWDIPVWIALILFPLGLAPVLHGERLAQQAYGANFWAKPQLGLLLLPFKRVLTSNLFLMVMVPFALWMALTRSSHAARATTAEENRAKTGFTTPEWVLVVTLALMPVYVLPLSYLIHVYRALYLLEFSIGFWVVLIALFAEQGRRSARAAVALLVLLCLYIPAGGSRGLRAGVRALLHPGRVHERIQQGYNEQPWVERLRGSDLPIVAGEHLTYAQLQYYGTPDITRRLVILTDLGEIAQVPASETGQKNMLLFGPALGFHTMGADDFLSRHDHFLMPVLPDPGGWMMNDMLRREGDGTAAITFLGPEYPLDESAAMADYEVRLGSAAAVPATHGQRR